MLIPAHWNGPPASANGGYTCGLVARELGATSAEVILRAPPPLDTELAVQREEEWIRLLDGSGVVAEGRPARTPSVEPPRMVSLEEAAVASRAGEHRWAAHHPFPTCVVCGPERDDGMRLFPGAVEGSLFAARWTGVAAAEQVWAALDCPTSAPVANFGVDRPVVLARLRAGMERLPSDGEELAVLSWPLRRDGRKREAAAVLVDAEGSILARAHALWIELRDTA